jgi:MoaA/NifB/PqqE/SkfB family radical SAM enzyme
MNKIRIVNWILTRKCNLKCDYCAIVKDYANMPYHSIGHYMTHEMTTLTVLEALESFKNHNPETFHIFYGGEPLLRKDLPQIINFCNDNNIHYTIISNNTPQVQPMLNKLLKETNGIKGFTSSIDPVIFGKNPNKDRIKKSIEGFKRLKELKEKKLVDDVVAEITVMNDNQHNLYPLVKQLSKIGIYSDITFVDIKKSMYYDFSNVEDEDILVKPTFELAKILTKIMEDKNLLVHMKDVLIPKMFDTLPSEFNCELENGIHNVTVDADGTMRLCLRIKGMVTQEIHVRDIFDEQYPILVSRDFYNLLTFDKKRLCQLCNHSCLMMSQHIDKTLKGESDLIHKDQRGG